MNASVTGAMDGTAPLNRAPMTVLATRVYRGPHLYSATPMIQHQLDLGALEQWPTDKLPGFTEALLRLLPNLNDHHCSYDRPGGLTQRMAEGTWIGHVAEHVALELQALAGHKVSRGKTRAVKGRPGVYNVMYAYRDEEVGLRAGAYALRLVNSLLPVELQGLEGVDGGDRPFDLAEALDELRAMVKDRSLGPTTSALVEAALGRGIPVTRLNDQSLVRLGWGRNQRVIRASITGQTSLIAVETAGDKNLTKQLLSKANVPVPRGAVVRTAEQAVAEASSLAGPVVTKPLDGNHGRGVSLGLTTPEAVRWGFEQAARHGRRVIVEEQFQGRDYRILVVNGRVAAVAERVPAQVVGDGRSTVAELIEEVNKDPRRGRGHETVMTRIEVDDHVREMLNRAGMTLESVPEAGRTVVLRATANLSTGGMAIDRTDEIHPDNASIARRAAGIVGLDVAGIDFITPDITRSAHDAGGGVVEVNAAPGFRMHLEPSRGTPRDVARPVIDMLFPRGARSRVPLIAVTGTNGKSTTVRMVVKMLARKGLTVGFTTTAGVYIGEERIYKGDASGPKSARMVLAEPTVEAAVLETARGGIVREGLGFDTCDVGCVLNITADHLGIGGVNSLEELAAVKSVVTESVCRRGVSVLNADDPMTIRMARHAGGRIGFFTLNGGPDLSPLMQKHIAQGGLAAVVEPSIYGGEIILYDRGERKPILSALAIPGTLEGLASFNIANAAAASLIAYGAGVEPDTIAAALSTFHSSFDDNPGRLNIFDAHGFRVIMDYAHNPAGLTALGAVIEKLRPRYRRVIGTVSIPGDRRDDDIRQMGVIATGLMDHIVFRERPDGRGRKAGEVLNLMREGAISAGAPDDRIECILEEKEAVAACLRRAEPGDLVIILPTNVEPAWRQILEFKPPRREVRPAGERRLHV